MKKVKFFTLGCKVNQYETQGLREQFLRAGFSENNSRIADIYIINTCTVTQRADSESRRLIRKALNCNPQAKIIATGCYVEKDAGEILQISDRIQIVPNRRKHRIVNLLSQICPSRHCERSEAIPLRGGFALSKAEIASVASSRLLRNDGSNRTFFPLSISTFKDHERAFVKVQDGCENFCSYCIVPFVRGGSQSRSLKEIVAEVERLTNRGFKEIVLTGICLGDYHYRGLNLVNVLAHLENIEGEFRIRLSSIEPQLISADLIEKIASSGKICSHLHIPLQSGDNKILKMMNRRYTQKEYLSLIAKVKKKIKDVAITTDILVGFPGEKQRNFRNTVDCLKEISPLRSHIFSFSLRRATAAFSLPGRIEPQLIRERVNLLKEVAEECSYKFRRHFLGKRLSVLIESQPDRQKRCLRGYSENYIRVVVEGAGREDVNSLLPVEVKGVDRCFTWAKKVDDKGR